VPRCNLFCNAAQNFFSGVVGLAAEFPLYEAGHPNNKPKRKEKQ
jgi:hypothetical protein